MMKSVVLALALLVAASYATDSKSWNEWFDNETATCQHLCEEPQPNNTTNKATVPTTPAVQPAGPTTGDYSIVTEGYTPAPGECVCVGSSTVPGASVSVEASTVPEASSIASLMSTPESVASTPGEYHSHCILIEFFYNCSSLFTGELQIVWLNFIEHCELTIFAVESYSLEVKFIKCVYALKALFVQYSEIEIALQYEWVQYGSFKWGYVIDLFTVAVNVEYQYIGFTIELDAGGSCPLFDALLNYTEGNQQQHDACVSLIDELKVIIQSSYYSVFDKYYLIYVKFESFFSAHASWEAEFLGIEIEGFGTLEQFISVTYVFEQITTVDVVIGGSTSDCVLLQVLLSASQNTSYQTSVRSSIKEFYEVCVDFFETEVDVYVRLEFFLNQSFQWYVLEQWIVEDVYGLLLGEWGSFYELIAAGYFYEHCGWQSHITTLAASSTSALPETTVTPGDCSTRDELIVISSSNTTLLTTSLNEAFASWSLSYQNQFVGYKKRVENLIWSSISVPDKLSNCSKVLGNYATDDRQTTLEAVQISWWGTVGQFCECSGY